MKLSRLVMSAACLISAQFSALSAGEGWRDCNAPCHSTKSPRCFDMETCDMQYHVYADYLFWDVQKSDLALGRDGEETEHYLNPDYDSGFRIGATAAWDNWDLGLRYTWLRNRTDADIPDPLNDFEARFHFDLNVLDIEIGHSCCLNCGPILFRPFVGAKFAWIEDRFNTLAGGALGSDNRIDFKGYGLYIGASGRWELCNYQMCDYNLPIALVMRGSTGIMRSRFKQDIRVNADGPITDPATLVHRDLGPQDLCTPVHEGYVGIDLTLRGFCDNEISFQFGYEAQYWGWREYNDEKDCSHLGMGGLVVRIGVSF